jgi:hypothetical protein
MSPPVSRALASHSPTCRPPAVASGSAVGRVNVLTAASAAIEVAVEGSAHVSIVARKQLHCLQPHNPILHVQHIVLYACNISRRFDYCSDQMNRDAACHVRIVRTIAQSQMSC